MSIHRMYAALTCAAWLLLASVGSQASCPSKQDLAELRARAELAASAPNIWSGWASVISGMQACAGSEAQILDAVERRTEALFQLGVTTESLRSALEWRRLAEASDNPRVHARALMRLARLQTTMGDVDAAYATLHAALARLEQDGTLAERANAWADLARLDRRRGQYLDALRHEQTALELRQQMPDRADVWRSALSIATLYEQVELLDQARERFAEALREVELRGTPADVASVLTSYAGFLNDFAHSPQNDSHLALSMAQRAQLLNSNYGDPVRLGSSTLQVGRAYFGLDDHVNAEKQYREAAALAEHSSAHALVAHIQFRWGELDLRLDRKDAALRRVESARKAYEEQGNRHRLIKTYALLEQIQQARGELLAAALAGREHFRLRNELLGAGASGRFGALLSQYAIADVKQLNEVLQQQNQTNALRMSAERRAMVYLAALVLVLGIALSALAWRHRQSRRLNDLLRTQAAEIERRRAEIETRRIELAAAHERLKAQSAQLYQASITDPLTGLRNRAHGLNALRELLGSARSLGLRPVVMMLDIDHFKQINDRYGHAVGDRALERVAENLLIHAPADAIVARLGGEEFLFVLRDADASSGMFHAELIRRRLLELPVEHDAGVVNISVSIGVCHCAELAQVSVQAALRAADHALYQAKGAGRNCVRAAS